MTEFDKDLRPDNIITYAALKRIRPNDIFWIDGSNIVFQDSTKTPTDSDISDAIALESAEWISNNYRRVRADKYPPIGDQLDDLFKANVFSVEMSEKILAVKNETPK